MSFGQILLILASVLVAAGACQRVLDRLYLTDRQALLFVALMLVGSLLPELSFGSVKINIGGALIPILLAAYTFFRAGAAYEKGRAAAASFASAAAVLAIGIFFPDEPDAMPFDVNYLYGIAAGLIASTLGRSRRAAFIAGVSAPVLADSAQALHLRLNGIEQTLYFGGAGLFDAIVLSGIIAVGAAELMGELRERAARGAMRDPTRKIKNGRIVKEDGK